MFVGIYMCIFNVHIYTYIYLKYKVCMEETNFFPSLSYIYICMNIYGYIHCIYAQPGQAHPTRWTLGK